VNLEFKLNIQSVSSYQRNLLKLNNDEKCIDMYAKKLLRSRLPRKRNKEKKKKERASERKREKEKKKNDIRTVYLILNV